MLNKDDLQDLIQSPSLSAITYEAETLSEELDLITEDEYPEDACSVRNVLLCLTSFILARLRGLYDPQTPYGIKGGGLQTFHVVQMAKRLHDIYAYVRFLKASAPRQTPPAIQFAFSELTQLHFPRANGRPVCVVRPQWEYNFGQRSFKDLYSDVFSPPPDQIGQRPPDFQTTFVSTWQHWRATRIKAQRFPIPARPPLQVGIVSFPGLDTADTLLYPLLAHELAHFIASSYSTEPHKSAVRLIAKHDYVRMYRRSRKKNPLELWLKMELAKLNERLDICAKEILADLLAIRMVGFSFFAANAEYLKTVSTEQPVLWREPPIRPSGYPGMRFRLMKMFNYLDSASLPGNALRFLEENTGAHALECEGLKSYLDQWQLQLFDDPGPSERDDLEHRKEKLLVDAVEQSMPAIMRKAERVIPTASCCRLSPNFFRRIKLLTMDLPPSIVREPRDCFSEILSAPWAYQLLYGEERERVAEGSGQVTWGSREYRKTCRLALKAIELIPESRRPVNIRKVNASEGPTPHGVLSSDEIRRRIDPKMDEDSHLALMHPGMESIQPASLQLRLGHWFTMARRSRVKSVRLDPSTQDSAPAVAMEEVFVPRNKTFLLHPGDLVLGASLELFAIPRDLMAFVEGRSSLGRMGLTVATAAQVAPGFHGVIVLELGNTGPVPLELGPGIWVAQLVLQRLTEPVSKEEMYRGRFYCQTKP